ncbi:MAG: MATE family efflux transporter, partial [candidate division WOR-3 bacterium]
MKGTVLLDDRRVGRVLLKLSVPSFIGMTVALLYNLVDTIFVGHYCGPPAIAALTVVFPFQMLCMGVGEMIGTGAASFVSRSLGAGERKAAEIALGNSFVLSAGFTAGLMGITFPKSEGLASLMGASGPVLPLAVDYLNIILFGIGATLFSLIISLLIRAEGNALVPMLGMVVGAGMNVLLDAIAVVWLRMGVRGAALATVVSQIISVGYMASYYMRRKGLLRIKKYSFVPHSEIMWKICSVG